MEAHNADVVDVGWQLRLRDACPEAFQKLGCIRILFEARRHHPKLDEIWLVVREEGINQRLATKRGQVL